MTRKRIIAGGASAIMLGLAATSCSNLEDKTVLVDAGATGIKATSAADSSTGTATPTVWMGIFNFLFLDHPKDAPAVLYYKSQAATMNSSAVTTTFVWIKDGTKTNLSVKPDEVVNLPGLKVAAGGSTVNITTSDSTDSKSSNAAVSASASSDSKTSN